MKATIYHNSKCSKSRQAYQILQKSGLDIQVINYLETPPSIQELDKICNALNITPQNLIRKNEPIFKNMNLTINSNKTRLEWFKILTNNPQLIERPIVKIGEKIALGRPPENILKILPENK